MLRDCNLRELWVTGADSEFMKQQLANAEDYAARKVCFKDFREVLIPDCGHMMHHDLRHVLAKNLEDFLASPASPTH